MKKNIVVMAGFLTSFALGFYGNSISVKQKDTTTQQTKTNTDKDMKLGAFSVSLSVKDLKASKEFYEHLGFKVFGGGMEKNYLVMKNETTLVGLFQGMFEGNILTFNPGWDENAQNIDKFDDVREIQKHLKSKNIKLTAEADEKTSGPAYVMLSDPDGNMIYIDQHR